MAALINVRPSRFLGPSRQFRSDRTCGPHVLLGFTGWSPCCVHCTGLMSIILCSLEPGLGWRPSSILLWLFSLVGTKKTTTITSTTTKRAQEYDMFFKNSTTVMEMSFLGNLSAPWHLGNTSFHSFVVFCLYVHTAYMHFEKCAKKRFYLPLRSDSKNTLLRGLFRVHMNKWD